MGVRRIGHPFDFQESASGVKTHAEGPVMIWYQENYRDDVVLILRVQHYLAPGAGPDGEGLRARAVLAPRSGVGAGRRRVTELRAGSPISYATDEASPAYRSGLNTEAGQSAANSTNAVHAVGSTVSAARVVSFESRT